MATLYDCMSRDDLIAECERWKHQAARNAGTAVRYQIALKLARKYGMASHAFDGGVSVMLADWLDHSPHVGVPWPSSVFAQEWLTSEGYSEVKGKIGMRAIMTMAEPSPVAN